MYKQNIKYVDFICEQLLSLTQNLKNIGSVLDLVTLHASNSSYIYKIYRINSIGLILTTDVYEVSALTQVIIRLYRL